MSAGLETDALPVTDRDFVKHASGLLSQQIWCWGQDILRPAGNWLVERGFERIPAPADRENCSSVYALELPRGRRVVLRGFGVFYGDDQFGGVFVERYEFRPRYTAKGSLDTPLWSTTDLPPLASPTESQADSAIALTLGLIDWISAYEEDVACRLGGDYRQATLDRWENGKRLDLPAEAIADAWRSLRSAASRGALLP